MTVVPMWTVNPHEPPPIEVLEQIKPWVEQGFTPTTHVIQPGQTMGHVFCVSATRERFEKYTGASITWADGTVTSWTELQLYRTYPSDNCKGIAYPVPADAPEGEAAFTVRYEWQDRETGEYDDASASQRYWVGPNPVPRVTISPSTVGWGGSVLAIVEYISPGAAATLSLEIAGKFINAMTATAGNDWVATLFVKALNRWSTLIDYVGTGTAILQIPGRATTFMDLTIRKAFWWATEQPYEGATVTYVETYRTYKIYYLSGPGGIYGATDPYANEMPSGSTTLEGMRTLIDNWLGAVYTLTVTSNLSYQVTVGEHTIQTNSSITLLNGCYEITCPAVLVTGGAPWVVDYMQNLQTDVKFYGVNSIVQCLSTGPATIHIEHKPAEEDLLLETYRGIEILYDWRPAQPDPYKTCFYAKVGSHGKWFPVTQYAIEDVRAWVDGELVMQVGFTADPTYGPAPLTVTFTTEVTQGVSPYTWSLNPGDGAAPYTGSKEESGSFNQVHTYIKAGTFTATVTVTDSQGASAVARAITSPGGAAPGRASAIAVAAPLIAGSVIIAASRKR